MTAGRLALVALLAALAGTPGVPASGESAVGVPSARMPAAGVPTVAAPAAGVPGVGVPGAGVPAARAPAVGVAVAGAASPGADVDRLVRRVTEGTLLWRTAGQESPTPAPLLATDVAMRVTGMVVRATVRQQFENPAKEWAEGIYVFPLPEDAAVDHVRMQVGTRTIEGVIRERAAAKATYEKAKQAGKRASLVEQERANVFTTSVANIPPGAAITIEIEYQQAVRYDQGQFHLRFPMVVGPRYVPGIPLDMGGLEGPPMPIDRLGGSGRPPNPPGARRTPAKPGRSSTGTGWAPDTDAVPDASRITPPVRHPAAGSVNPVKLRIELQPGMPLARLEATYHPVDTTARPDGGYEITLAEGAVLADRDFELVWQPVTGIEPAPVLLSEERDGQVYALLMVMPPAPASLEAVRVPREVIFVVDTSGSMQGASIDQARAALKMALVRLQDSDTFNVVRFSDVTESLFPAARPASTENRRLADRYVGALHANGGTEMLPALLRALDGNERHDRLRQVVFLTDGAVGNEAQLFEAIRARLGDSRLFTIGIGSAPNSHFMREAARLGRGTFTYIGSTAEVQEKMTALFRKLESPALTDLSLELPGAVQAEVLPAQIPDVYLGEPVIVTLRATALTPYAVLRGRVAGAVWEREVFLEPVTADAGLAVHWAKAKIAALLDARATGAADDDVRQAVTEVALAHHLVSRHTSLVAVDVTRARPGDATLRSHALETNLPHGWDHAAVVGLGQGATPGPLHVALGAAALLMAAGLCVCLKLDLAVALSRRARRA